VTHVVDDAFTLQRASLEFVDAAVAAARRTGATRIGPIPVELAASTQHELDQIAQHVRGGTGATWPTLRVTLVDSTTMDPETIPRELRPAGEETLVWNGDTITAVANGFDGTFWLLDRTQGHAVRWLADPEELPYGEQVSPLSLAVRWWASIDARGALVHAGGIADDDGAVLLGGNSGAGKSTSTMACAHGDLVVLGDDQVIIEIGEQGPVAHPVYRLAKLTPDSLDLLPHLREHVLAEGRYGKSLIDLSLDDVAPRPVRAVCLVSQDPTAATHLAPIARADVLKAIGISTMFQLSVAKQHTWTVTSALVRSSPCHHLVVGRPGEVPEVLHALLRELGQPEPPDHEVRPT
jgi:hypothetical protein